MNHIIQLVGFWLHNNCSDQKFTNRKSLFLIKYQLKHYDNKRYKIYMTNRYHFEYILDLYGPSSICHKLILIIIIFLTYAVERFFEGALSQGVVPCRPKKKLQWCKNYSIFRPDLTFNYKQILGKKSNFKLKPYIKIYWHTFP